MAIRFFVLLVLTFSSLVLSATSTEAADAVCLSRDIVSDRLAERHAEQPSAAGLASNGQVLEVFSSRDGTWTLVLTNAEGVSCVIASGNAWTTLPPPSLAPLEG